MIQEYCVGFLHDDDEIVVIRKNRPAWQEGYFNGVGGHIEPGETPYKAMLREFFEETGVWVRNWDQFATLTGPDAIIHVFAARDNNRSIPFVQSATDEEVHRVKIDEFPYDEAVPNLKWLVPLALQRDKYYKPIEVRFPDYA